MQWEAQPRCRALLSLGHCSSLDHVSGWKALVFAVGTVQSLGSSVQGHGDLALHGPMLRCSVSAWLLPWSEVNPPPPQQWDSLGLTCALRQVPGQRLPPAGEVSPEGD